MYKEIFSKYAETTQNTAFCELGYSPISAVRSNIENFRDEFIAITQE
ncbi:MAG TPA: hypothetical protein GXX77_06550 [Candidatus Cloacimonetes bacterium]|nr:hypothetical protein [Candidatus Cloacimonadota bacterium]